MEAQKQMQIARGAVIKWLDGFGVIITNEAIISKLIALYLDGVKHGLQEAREIYNDKGGEV